MTIRHMVFFHHKSTTAHDDTRLEDALQAEVDLVAAALDGQEWMFGPDVSRRPGAPDYVGVGDFESTGALQDFLAHPAHAEAAQLWGPLATFTVADLHL